MNDRPAPHRPLAVRIDGAPADCLDVLDRGLNYGDGLFETIAVVGGVPRLWRAHMARLARGCGRLGFPPCDPDRLYDEVVEVAGGAGRAVVKLLLTRGSGGRGYRPPAAEETRTRSIAIAYPWPAYVERYRREGVAVRMCEVRLAVQPLLAGIKHLNRLEYVLARREWRDEGIAEGLLRDTQGDVIEATQSNLFLVIDGVITTPDLSGCGVAGVMRERILACAREVGMPVRVAKVSPEALGTASELFLSNSVVGLYPVHHLGQRVYPLGVVARQLSELLDAVPEGSGP